MPSSAAGRSGSRPSASTMVCGELDRQRGLEHDHRHAGSRRCSRATFRPSAVCVSIDHAEALGGVADGGQAVGVACSCRETKPKRAMARERGSPTGRTRPSRCRLVAEQLGRALRRRGRSRSNTKRSKLLALVMSIDGLEVSCVSAAGAHAVDAGAEELVEHVVLVGGQHQPVDRQAHHARHVAGADVAEVAGGHGEARPHRRRRGVAWK